MLKTAILRRGSGGGRELHAAFKRLDENHDGLISGARRRRRRRHRRHRRGRNSPAKRLTGASMPGLSLG